MNKFEQAREKLRPEARRRWDADAALRAEFSHDFDQYLAYETSVASGKSKVLGGQVRHA